MYIFCFNAIKASLEWHQIMLKTAALFKEIKKNTIKDVFGSNLCASLKRIQGR